MGQDFDKIIRENLEALFLPFVEKLLDIKIISRKRLPDKLATTNSREVDFSSIIKTAEGEEFILHLEFQSVDDPQMVYRMAEYKAILQRKHRILVRQFVIYLGSRPSRMRTRLLKEEQIIGFDLVDIVKLDYRNLIYSQIPEEILLAILCNFGEEDPERIIRLILEQLKRKSTSESELRRYINQLTVLSKLRKLDQTTTKQIKTMPITIDWKTHTLFQEGKMEGEKEGIQKGIKEGVREIILNMLKTSSLSVEEISTITGVSMNLVSSFKSELNSEDS